MDARLVGTSKEATGVATAEFRDLRLNGRDLEVDPIRVAWDDEVALVDAVALRHGGGSVSTPYVAVRLESLTPDPKAESRMSLPAGWISGPLTVKAMPVELIRQLVEPTAWYRGKDAERLREGLKDWDRVGGVIEGEVRVVGEVRPRDLAHARVLIGDRPVHPPIEVVFQVAALEPPGSWEWPQLNARGDARIENEVVTIRAMRLERSDGPWVDVVGTAGIGRTPETRRLDLNLRSEGLPLATIAGLPVPGEADPWRVFRPMRGELNLTAQVLGTSDRPLVRFSGSMMSPMIAGVPLDRIVLTNGEYSAQMGVLSVGQIEVAKSPLANSPEARVLLSGRFPLSWPELTISPDAPRLVEINFPRQPLEVVTALAMDADTIADKFGQDGSESVHHTVELANRVAAEGGWLEGAVTLGGTGNAPQNRGQVTLSAPVIRLLSAPDEDPTPRAPMRGRPQQVMRTGLYTEVRDFSAVIRLEGNEVRLAQFEGVGSQGGSFTGAGTITLGRGVNAVPSARLDLRMMVEDFRVKERDLGEFLGESLKGVTADLTISSANPAQPEQAAPLRVRGTWPTPLVSGGLRIDDALLPLAIDQFDPPKTELPTPVRLNLRVMAGRSVWMRNPMVRLRLGGGLTVTNTLTEPVVRDALQVTDGTIVLPLLRLRRVTGSVRVNYDSRRIGSTDAAPIYLDLRGETTLRVQTSALVDSEYYDAIFEIRGAPSVGSDAGVRPSRLGGGFAIGSEGGLTLTVRTDPPLPGSEIEAIIRQQLGVAGFEQGGSNVVEALQGQLEQALAVNIAPEFTEQIEDTLRSALGLDTISFDIGVTQPLRVRLGRRLFGPIFGSVTQNFGRAADGRDTIFEIYYRVTPRIRFGYRQEEPLGRQLFYFSGSWAF